MDGAQLACTVPTAHHPRCPLCRYSPAQVPHTTLYHLLPTFPVLLPPSHPSSRHFHHAPTRPSCCCPLAPRARLLLTSSTASTITICCCQTAFNQPEFDRLARDIQSSAHYRYLAHPPLPGPPHCQLLIKSISPLSRVTSRFPPINSLIPLTNFGNPEPQSLSALVVAISNHYRRLCTWIDATHPGLV